MRQDIGRAGDAMSLSAAPAVFGAVVAGLLFLAPGALLPWVAGGLMVGAGLVLARSQTSEREVSGFRPRAAAPPLHREGAKAAPQAR